MRIRCCLMLALVTAQYAVGADTRALDTLVPLYEVARVTEPIEIDGKLDEPAWFAADSVGAFQFPWFKSGEREQSIVKLIWDDRCLYIASLCQDRHITARHKEHDGAIPSDDCLEIMLSPDAARPAFYFNLEWNVVGGYVDGHRPNGADSPRVEWNASDVKLAGSYLGTLNDDQDVDRLWQVEVALPWSNFREHLSHFPPQAGDEFRANFNRHGGDTNMQYSQWSPVGTPAPAFHVPLKFGVLKLTDQTVPFPSEP